MGASGGRVWEQVCRFEGCTKKLRSDNRSRLCRTHHQKGGTCFRCLKPCARGFHRCDACRVVHRKDTARVVGPCTAVGCNVRVHSKSGLCFAHYLVGGGTCTATGCKQPLIFGTRTGLCREHQFLSRKLRRWEKQCQK